MKLKSIQIIIFIMISGLNLYAQNSGKIDELREQARATKTLFISEKLNLPKEVGIKFWPVFNDFYAEYESILDERLNLIIFISENFKTLKKNEASKFLEDYSVYEEKMRELNKRYIPKFSKVLTPQKLVMFYQYWKQMNSEYDIEIFNSLSNFEIQQRPKVIKLK